jgi:hypothetical protein
LYNKGRCLEKAVVQIRPFSGKGRCPEKAVLRYPRQTANFHETLRPDKYECFYKR